MFIDRINIKSFGPFEKLSLKFNPKGINVVFGDNGTGKSQIVAGIIGAITPQPEIFIKTNNDATADSEFNISFIDNDQTENIIISKTVKTNCNFNVDKSNSGKISEKIYRVTKDDKMPSLLLNLFEYNEPPKTYNKLALNIFEEIPIEGKSALLWKKLRNALYHDQAAQFSRASLIILEFAKELYHRLNSSFSIPLIIDFPFNLFDDESILLVLEILNKIGAHDQVIIFSLDTLRLRELIDNSQFVFLLDNNRKTQWHQLSKESDAQSIWHSFNESNKRSQKLDQEQKLDQILKVINSTHETVNELNEKMSRLLSRIELLVEKYSEDLELAILKNNDTLVDRICSDISTTASRILRSDVEISTLDSYEKELKDEIGVHWSSLNTITKKDIVISKYLIEEKNPDIMHLSILVICRAIEGEILNKLFYPFQQYLKTTDKTIDFDDNDVPNKFKSTYKMLWKFAMDDDKPLTLGQFSWVLKAANKARENNLFKALLEFMDENFCHHKEKISELIIDLFFAKDDKYIGLEESITNLRNRCAHPPSFSSDGKEFMTKDTYYGIWQFSLKQPLELLLLMSKNNN
jgi:hypothetical protein